MLEEGSMPSNSRSDGAITSGPVFGAGFDESAVQRTHWGTATFTFETVDPVGADERVFVRLKVASR